MTKARITRRDWEQFAEKARKPSAHRLLAARYPVAARSKHAALDDAVHCDFVEVEVLALLDDGRVPTRIAIQALVNLTAVLEDRCAEGIDCLGGGESVAEDPRRKRRRR